MREIKFRALRNGKTWWYSDDVNIYFKDGYLFEFDNMEDVKIGEAYQHTGLKDKNGVEIYEGDIVDAWSQGSNAKLIVKWGQGRVGFFLWREHLCWNLSGGGKDYNKETVEVIGNIYENPELLKGIE